ncbi:MAG: TetR/AcrR family transcriptional regulator [Phenylobacterium sp.]|nr:TetR/AcrR family transcriptional regulator [Phenylobacterium sp.]
MNSARPPSPDQTQGARLDGYIARHNEFRGRILDAAEALISEAGDTSFGTRELAARAGVSAATPFNHFGSKRGILSAIVDRSLEELGSSDVPPQGLGDPLEHIFRHTDRVVSFYAARPELYRPVLGELAGNAASSPFQTLQRANASWRAGLVAALEAGQLRTGRDLDVLAGQLETNWLGSLVLWIVGRIDGEGWKVQSEYGTALALGSIVAATEWDRLQDRIAGLEARLADPAGAQPQEFAASG